jgi:hypothetical protein
LEYRTPIFCDECSTLALACFEERVLCTVCLITALASRPDDALSRVTPLWDDGGPDPEDGDGKGKTDHLRASLLLALERERKRRDASFAA